MRISVFQALTLLAQKYRFSENPDTYTKIKQLYLSGVTSVVHQKLLTQLLQDELLDDYDVSDDWNIINEDPVRRYFESHLAHETLLVSVDKLPLNVLTQHKNSLMGLIYNYCSFEASNLISQVLGPNPNLKSLNPTTSEFATAAHSLGKEQSYPSFSPLGQTALGKERKNKLKAIVASFYIGLIFVLNSRVRLPLEKTYSEDNSPFRNRNRGRIIRLDPLEEHQIRAHALGIMRSYMPLSADDVLFNEEKATYSRPCERCTYASYTEVTNAYFSTKVNPLIAAISGTMLTQVRAIAFLCAYNTMVFQGAHAPILKEYFRTMIGFFLYFSGGHSLKEYTDVFELPEIQAFFQDYPQFRDLNLNYLFHTDNEEAFEKALTKAIDYNQIILQKKKIGMELTLAFSKRKETKSEQSKGYFKITKKDILSAINTYSLFLYRYIQFNIFTSFTGKLTTKKDFILAAHLLYRLISLQQKMQSTPFLEYIELSIEEVNDFKRKTALLIPQNSSLRIVSLFAEKPIIQSPSHRRLNRSPRIYNLVQWENDSDLEVQKRSSP